MTTYELTRDQMIELKQAWMCEHKENASYADLFNADFYVMDRTIHEEYAGVVFSPDDFTSK